MQLALCCSVDAIGYGVEQSPVYWDLKLIVTQHRCDSCCITEFVQELELQSRFMTALDALSSTNSLAARHALEQSLPVSAGGADTVGGRLPTDSGVGLDNVSCRSRFEAFDARLRRTLVDHINRAETVEVSCHHTTRKMCLCTMLSPGVDEAHAVVCCNEACVTCC